ncbi:Fatty acid desaturase 6 [Acipenser ruthenus]|uniref:Fatty acid desaturase 6 n=1 Tax=Acipenser ruthenus TaxID=7906 RepID=A0A662YZS9_ACIRT|nr:Fatty acid desaturase 6 [Acipenser ruthenus]
METLSDAVLQREEAEAQRGIGDAGERSWKNLERKSSFQEGAGQEIPGNERQFQDLTLPNEAGESKKENAEEEMVPALVHRSGKYKGEKMQKETVMMELTGLVQKAVNESSWWERRGIDCAILTAAFLSLPAGFLLLGCSQTLLFSLGILVMGTAHAVITVKGTHLASHGSLSESQAWGRFWAVFFIELCGSFTARAGVQAHIKVHHAHTNIIGLGDSSTWKLPFLPRYVYMFVAPLAVPVITPVVAFGTDTTAGSRD